MNFLYSRNPAASGPVPEARRDGTCPLNHYRSPAAFCRMKIASARYFIKHVLPEVDAAARGIKSQDLSMMEIADEAFAG